MFHRGIIPPIGVKESCILLTLPVVKDVVISVNNIEAISPNLISLPSILIPFNPYLENIGTPCFSKWYNMKKEKRNKANIGKNINQPCFLFLAAIPKPIIVAPGIIIIHIISI